MVNLRYTTIRALSAGVAWGICLTLPLKTALAQYEEVVLYQGASRPGSSAEYDGVSDTTLVSGSSKTFNFGARAVLSMGQAGQIRRFLLKFDLSELRGKAVDVVSAELRLTQIRSKVSAEETFNAYPVAEGNADWIQGTGDSVEAKPGEPAWSFLAAGDGTGGEAIAWSRQEGLGGEGIDYVTAPAITDEYQLSNDREIVTFMLEPKLVLSWIYQPEANGGLLFRGTEMPTEQRFVSNGYYSSEAPEPSQRPTLVLKLKSKR